MATGPAVELRPWRATRRRAGRRRRASASVSAATRREVRARRPSATAVEPQVDPVVELEPGLAAQVLDRALELAGVALGAQLRRQLRVDHDDEAVVVGDGRARARRGQDLDLVGRQRRRRRASPSRPSRNSTSPSRAAAITAGIAGPRRLPIFGSSGLTRRSTSSDSSPISSTCLTLTSSATSAQQLVAERPARAGQREPGPGQRLARARPACRAASGRARRRRARSPSTPRAPRRGGAASSSAGQRVRWTLSGAAASTVDDEVLVHRSRPGTAGSAPASGVAATSAAWSVANAASRSAGVVATARTGRARGAGTRSTGRR